MRAAIIRTNAMTMSVRAAPQARDCAPTYGDTAFEKICEGSEVLAPLNTFRFTVVTVRMVKSSGAVSPAARATASRAPLTIPPMAAGNTTVSVTRALVAPRA
jgi:hypothetical protein